MLVSSPSTGGGFWSQDGGNTWQAIKPPTRYPVASCLVASHSNRARWRLSTTALPGAHESSIFRTDDKGASWQRLATGVSAGESVRSLSAHHNGEFLVAVLSAGAPLVSRDGGNSWSSEDLAAGRE
ncbi:WD40/YVTN/BNR-like repeat-containing protein [Streptomyces sp. NPDC006463]|uniref:WD40/YVTN/BNR-like repeat-containing protein n=1 Tax=Streptomyces sp. NPDC006463 TaxID=3364746 RepID=UPI0036B4D05F